MAHAHSVHSAVWAHPALGIRKEKPGRSRGSNDYAYARHTPQSLDITDVELAPQGAPLQLWATTNELRYRRNRIPAHAVQLDSLQLKHLTGQRASKCMQPSRDMRMHDQAARLQREQ